MIAISALVFVGHLEGGGKSRHQPPGQITFEQQVRPILKANCFDCHGESEKAKGDLDLRLRRLIVKGGESGPAIAPGNAEKSLLYQKVLAGEMPKREKKLTGQEIETIRRWIAEGAKTAGSEPSEVGAGMIITDEERRHWAFQPISNPPVPRVKNRVRGRTPIDHFLLAELAKHGLSFSEEAPKVTLLRRACFDLTGLPPTPEQSQRFFSDTSSSAYERLIEELLSSPHYGERWGRHWLDVAGYADSDGVTEADTPRPYAWKYRDYVIRSFNLDKPFNEFICEQLAGDELAGVSLTNAQAAAQEEQVREKLIATGFLRMAADGTGAGGGGGEAAALRNQVVADTIKIVSTSMLGLSVGCAQCHDHRYDPIPQTDYYRLRAVFEPAFNCNQWKTPSQRLVSLYSEEDRKAAAVVEEEAKAVVVEKEKRQKEYLAEALEKHLREKFPEELRAPLREAWQTPADKRTAEQKKLLAEHPSVNIHPGVLYQYNPKAADDLKAMDAKIAEIRGRKPQEDFVSAFIEGAGEVPVTYLFHRGDYKQPKQALGPGGLTVLGRNGRPIEFPPMDPGRATSGRRLALAKWLTSSDQPLVARVLVNRVWMDHFGRGLVGTPADFGFTGEKPANPELLDWLARSFMEHGWSMKQLQRLIMTSAVYRQSSHRDAMRDRADPDNRLYSRRSVQRLDAEALRDAILAASGVLNRKLFGAPVPVREDAVGQIVVGIDKKEGDTKAPVEVPMGDEEFRRSIYIQVRRSKPLAFLTAFDAPVMEVNCERRVSSTAPTQSLMLMNSAFILQQASKFAERLEKEAGAELDKQIDLGWRLAFARRATEEEISRAAGFIRTQVERWQRIAAEELAKEGEETGKKETGKKEGKPAPAKRLDPGFEALANFCQALFSSNEFCYID